MIAWVQVVLLVGAVCGGGLAFNLFDKDSYAGGIASAILAFAGLAGIVALELLVVRG